MKRTPACLGLIHPWVFCQPHGSNTHLPPKAPNKVNQRWSKEKGSGLLGEPWVYGNPKSPGPTPRAGPQMEPQQEVRGGFQPRALRVKAGSLGAGLLPEGSPMFPGGLWGPSPLFPGPLYPGQVSSALGVLPRAWPSCEQQPLWIPRCRKNGVPAFPTTTELIWEQMAPPVSPSCIHVPCFWPWSPCLWITSISPLLEATLSHVTCFSQWATS